MKRINVEPFVKESVDMCLPKEYLSLDEVYKRAEEKRKNIKRWLTKYNKCENVDELISVNEHHRKSSDSTGEIFYLWNYINSHAENAFDVIMDFISVGNYPAYVIEDTLPFIFDHFKILNSYKYITGSKASYYKNRSRLKKNIEKIESEGYSSKIKKYYDENYHFYCIKTEFYCSNSAHKNRPDAASYLYFENFQSFVNYLHGDLSDCDLRYAHEDIKDELYVTNCNTILRKARTIIFGGIGFAGCNESFNATSGIYQDVINRDQEKKLSLEFNALYEKVEKTLCDQYLIVFTHMNINEWRTPYELHDKWIYVSGHSHVNAYYDDGLRRMCADNQVGYYNDHPHLKYFLIDNSYNLSLE